MSPGIPQASITVSLSDLENLIRRVVREEFVRLLRASTAPVVDDWDQEGPLDPAGDEQLLHDALTLREQYKVSREGWKTLEEFESELARSGPEHDVPR